MVGAVSSPCGIWSCNRNAQVAGSIPWSFGVGGICGLLSFLVYFLMKGLATKPHLEHHCVKIYRIGFRPQKFTVKAYS